jgi:hypothetical protein
MKRQPVFFCKRHSPHCIPNRTNKHLERNYIWKEPALVEMNVVPYPMAPKLIKLCRCRDGNFVDLKFEAVNSTL